jgi:very-short-patch-repair endonuclease
MTDQPATCSVKIDYSERINFAFQQNSIPVIRRIEITNDSEQDWYHVKCRIEAHPAWAEVHEQKIAYIPAGTTYTLTDVPLALEIDYLTQLSERVRGDIRITISRALSQATESEEPDISTIVETSHPVDVYAYDEWTGLITLPEILAAFVTPNLSVVEQLLSNTTQLLGKRTSSSALDGYQAKSKKRVFEILNAIYDSVREQQICYSNPPASFEQTGQRIRFGNQILKSKLGTCLDLCLLFASLAEQAGLNPLILMHKGHAYVGCWLIDESFSDPATDDLQSIRKRQELEELLVFETTLVCDGKGADFTRAVIAAKEHLSVDDIFEYAIDIHRSRSSRIRPLPLQRNEHGVDVQKAREANKPLAAANTTRPVNIEFHENLEVGNIPEAPKGRVEHWKQKLLDLTLNNRLLNFKETKQTIPLLCPQPEHMEDELAADQTFKILEQTPLIAGTDPRSLSLQAQQTEENPIIEHLMRELHAKRIRSSLTEKELSRRLIELYRKARLQNEESGANTLFLALGFLEWKSNKDDERIHRAPLLLVPVQLHRKSVQQGFTLERHDEDTLVNVSLLELLKRDYELEVPGVNPPPEDESGVDVDRVFRLFQNAVRDMPGWEVRRDVWLAQFSFSKFLLWKDLQDRSDILCRNAIVDHLINNPGSAFQDDLGNLEPHQLDETVNFDEIYCPMSADSSQLAAVVAASRGKNFVMNGPPGTGKSQTITNIIAHCLAEGKRVLFVAEKRAALEVVHHRLSQIGLGPFCLELHSNKSGKAEVLRQFGEAINYAAQHPSDEWHTLAKRLQKLRNELNTYVKELHKVYPNKLSAYQCYAWLIAQSEKGNAFKAFDQLDIPECEKQSLADFEQLQKICEDLMFRGQERRLPSVAKEALHTITASEWTPEWENTTNALGIELLQQIIDFRSMWNQVADKLGLNGQADSEQILMTVASLTTELRGAPALPAGFANEPNWTASFKPQAEQWIASGCARDAAAIKLEGFDLEALHQLDTASLEANWKDICEDRSFFKFLRWIGFYKPILACRLPGASKWDTYNGPPAFFENISILKKEQKILDDAKDEATAHFGTLYWNNGEVNWESLSQLLEFGDVLHSAVKSLAGDSVDRLIQLRSKLGDLISAGSEFLQEGGSLCDLFGNYSEAWSALSHSKQSLDTLLGIEVSAPRTDFLNLTEVFCQDLETNTKYLSAWCRWQDATKRAKASGLSALLEAHRNGNLDLNDFRKAFDYAYYNSFLNRLLTLSPLLRDFFGEEHQKRIDAFNDFDAQYTELTGKFVAAKLAAGLPRARTEDCPKNTELGMLQREMVKRRRHKPVRQLLAETPGVAPFLKPCFLMSPLSVAQYLDAEQTEFDIVIFDEASQIPVWDAVGAIARGKQVIVVGDPKQLPPTNFFSRADNDDSPADDSSETDLESILDEFLGSGIKQFSLLWHYRSRKEGLIAFSNYHYYNNELHTFPAPHSDDVGVKLVHVEGYYDKGKSRTNPAEAEAIKQEVIRRLTDPLLCEKSIGIVTFSQTQQSLILDKLDEARREHPAIEAHFGEEVDEPVFVKNLENVQGDERDVILFSICYGPDQAGKLSMNFGPLNRDGGERRLNVAVTRAKHDVVIFSTLRPEQIDLSRTRAIGAAHLKSYLEYAERGPAAIAANIESAQTADYDSVFEQEVAEFLRSKGYTVHTQIGCSGYRIDLAIVHPDSPGHYLLGIECDGATYHSAATARDRDRLRQGVLEGLGWRIHRIWSTDWWRNSSNAREDLIAEVEAALIAPVREDTPKKMTPPPATEPESEPEEALRYASAAPAVAATVASLRKQDYPEVILLPHGPSDNFYEPSSRPQIKQQITRIIKAEGPIKEDLLIRRVANEWGFNRVAAKIKKTVGDCLPTDLAKTINGNESVYWPDALEPRDYSIYRVADQDVRKLEDAPLLEICNAALDTLEKYISFPEDDFSKEIAKHFGFSRVTKKTTQLCDTGVLHLITDQTIILENGFYKITSFR